MNQSVPFVVALMQNLCSAPSSMYDTLRGLSISTRLLRSTNRLGRCHDQSCVCRIRRYTLSVRKSPGQNRDLQTRQVPHSVAGPEADGQHQQQRNYKAGEWKFHWYSLTMKGYVATYIFASCFYACNRSPTWQRQFFIWNAVAFRTFISKAKHSPALARHRTAMNQQLN